jgi:hypothetical protein
MTIFTRPRWCIEPLRPQSRGATLRRWTTRSLLVHLDSFSKPASAGYDRPAERPARCCF